MFDISMAVLVPIVAIGITVSTIVDSNNRARVEIAQMECRQ